MAHVGGAFALTEQLAPPGLAETVYPVTADPPLLAGADHETATPASLRSPATLIGAPGTVAGVTAVLVLEAEELPTTFEATTVNEYEVPLDRPCTVQVRTSAPVVQVKLPGLDVTA